MVNSLPEPALPGKEATKDGIGLLLALVMATAFSNVPRGRTVTLKTALTLCTHRRGSLVGCPAKAKGMHISPSGPCEAQEYARSRPGATSWRLKVIPPSRNPLEYVGVYAVETTETLPVAPTGSPLGKNWIVWNFAQSCGVRTLVTLSIPEKFVPKVGRNFSMLNESATMVVTTIAVSFNWWLM